MAMSKPNPEPMTDSVPIQVGAMSTIKASVKVIDGKPHLVIDPIAIGSVARIDTSKPVKRGTVLHLTNVSGTGADRSVKPVKGLKDSDPYVAVTLSMSIDALEAAGFTFEAKPTRTAAPASTGRNAADLLRTNGKVTTRAIAAGE